MNIIKLPILDCQGIVLGEVGYCLATEVEAALKEKDDEIARLRKALEFYASRKNWNFYLGALRFGEVDRDGGRIAREALQSTESGVAVPVEPAPDKPE